MGAAGFPTVAKGLMAVCCVLSCFQVHADVLYESRFERMPDGPARLSEWALAGGQYIINQGWLRVTSQRSNPHATLRQTHDGDGTFRATVQNARGCHWCALLAKGVYRLEINNQFVRLALQRLVGKEWNLVREVGTYWLYAHNTHEFELRLSFVGKKVYGFIDQKKLIEYEDP